MALSRTAWIAAGLGARLLMIALLIGTVKITFANEHKRPRFSDIDDGVFELRSYSYMVAAAVTGVAGSLLQIPVAVYLLFKSKRMTPSTLVLDISMYADVVITAVLATGVGAGFGVTVDLLWFANHAIKQWEGGEATHQAYVNYYSKAYIPVAFLLAGMVLSIAATAVSAKLRVRAANDVADN